MTTYCEYCNSHPEDTFNRKYHDTEYGFPLKEDNLLFERLILEINQAGLSWITILKKAENFRQAYDQFDIGTVAGYTAGDIRRLLNDAGIIRNRLKINAAIENAKRIQVIQSQSGSFKRWLDHHAKQNPGKEEWTKLFKKTFVFTGGEIVNEFLMSTGYLAGAHSTDCPVYKKVLKKKPVYANQKTP